MNTSPNAVLDQKGGEPVWKRFRSALRRLLMVLGSLGGIIVLLYLYNLLGMPMGVPISKEAVSYGLLFLVGFMTGFHCVGMCGPLVVAYTVTAAKRSGITYGAHLLYGAGKTLSYTIIGALFGGLGALVTFTPFLRGLAGIAAGVFLLLFGLGMLKVFAPLNRFGIRTPRFVMRFISQGMRTHSHPFIIGLLNGLMIICGPLQAMYILAAGTGSPIQGAKMLFVFGLGTLPLLLGFGALTSTLSAQFAPKIIKASGFLVIGLGAIMLNRGLAMTGSGYDFNSLTARLTGGMPQESIVQGGYQVIHMELTHKGFVPDRFALRKGVPVKWIIEGKNLTYCHHPIVVLTMGLEFDIHPGENIIEFTPEQTGIMNWGCGEDRAPGVFLVRDGAALMPEGGHSMNSADHSHAATNFYRKITEWWTKKVGARLNAWWKALKQWLPPDRETDSG